MRENDRTHRSTWAWDRGDMLRAFISAAMFSILATGPATAILCGFAVDHEGWDATVTAATVPLCVVQAISMVLSIVGVRTEMPLEFSIPMLGPNWAILTIVVWREGAFSTLGNFAAADVGAFLAAIALTIACPALAISLQVLDWTPRRRTLPRS